MFQVNSVKLSGKNFAHILYKVSNEIFKKKKRSYHIQKTFRDIFDLLKGWKRQCKNYRPISLTNIDYKIIAFVLAKPLQNILSQLINENQTACIQGRYIEENARLILDIFKDCENENSDGIPLFL